MRDNTFRRTAARLAGAGTALALGLGAVIGAPGTAQATDSSYTAGSRTTARWIGSIDTTSRAAVNSAYWNRYYPNVNVSTGWTGNTLGCLLGWTSSASQTATRTSLNFVRSLAGLAPVNFNSTLNARAQAAALMMAANNQLSHYPSTSWACYSSTGATTAGKSNLALAYPRLGSGQVVGLYMTDAGSTNRAAGHRRWVLNPFSTAMGNGSTTTSNALQVIGPTSSTRPNPKWVGWPTAGYFPSRLEPGGRWSVSSGYKSADFSAAGLRVYHNGVRVYGITRFAPANGYAMPTLVWQMPPASNRLGSWKVVVTNVKRPGYAPMSTTYRIHVFTPTR